MKALKKACENVVNTYESDGMEGMREREIVIYNTCKAALKEKPEAYKALRHKKLPAWGTLLRNSISVSSLPRPLDITATIDDLQRHGYDTSDYELITIYVSFDDFIKKSEG